MKWLLAVFLGAKVHFCSVYICFLVPFLIERLTKQKSTITATDRPLIKTVCLCPLNTVTVFFRTKFIFFYLNFFSFVPWQYLPELEACFCCFIVFMSLPLICHYLCSCRELLLMMHVWFLWACLSPIWSDLTRQHQLSDEQKRKKSKCECVEGDRDHC